MRDGIWTEAGGAGGRTLLLLHGLGGTAAVWQPLLQEFAGARPTRWIAADLPGHGASAWRDDYGVEALSAALAPRVAGARDLFIVGHSLGAYVALALASDGSGVAVQGVLGIGPKITWTPADLAAAREQAARPVRHFATALEAEARYRRVSGLSAQIAPDAALLQRGTVASEEGWRLSQDPRTFSAAGASFAELVASARARVMLARGAEDPLVSSAELREYDLDARDIAGRGHNVHVEDPAAVLALLNELSGAPR